MHRWMFGTIAVSTSILVQLALGEGALRGNDSPRTAPMEDRAANASRDRIDITDVATIRPDWYIDTCGLEQPGAAKKREDLACGRIRVSLLLSGVWCCRLLRKVRLRHLQRGQVTQTYVITKQTHRDTTWSSREWRQYWTRLLAGINTRQVSRLLSGLRALHPPSSIAFATPR